MNAMNPQPAAFDTLASFTELKDAGIDEKHAKALVSVFSRTASMPDISQLATKADLENVRIATKADIEQLRVATKAELEHQKERLQDAIEKSAAKVTADNVRWLWGGLGLLFLGDVAMRLILK